MFAEERQQAIAERIRRAGKVTVDELMREFAVSAPTVRADLTRLEEQGLLRRTHGGAMITGNTLYEPPFAERAVLRLEAKRAIACAAAGLVSDGETVLLDAGTTCHAIALRLREFKTLTVVTNSLASAQALAENPGIETVVIGGTLQARRRATLGALAAQFLESIRCDRAFVAMSGVDVAGGLTVVDFDAAQVKRRMLDQSDQRIVVADSSKIGQVAFARVAPLTSATLLVTDSAGSAEQRARLEEAGLRVLAAD